MARDPGRQRGAGAAGFVLAVFGFFFGLLGIVMGILPLGTLAVMPAAVALLCGLALYVLAGKSGKRKTTAGLLIAVAVLGLVLSIATGFFGERKVAEDIEFERKIERSVEEALGDLEELFGDEEPEKPGKKED